MKEGLTPSFRAQTFVCEIVKRRNKVCEIRKVCEIPWHRIVHQTKTVNTRVVPRRSHFWHYFVGNQFLRKAKYLRKNAASVTLFVISLPLEGKRLASPEHFKSFCLISLVLEGNLYKISSFVCYVCNVIEMIMQNTSVSLITSSIKWYFSGINMYCVITWPWT